MTHPEHYGKIWVEVNSYTHEGHYITPSHYEDKKDIVAYCTTCKKDTDFEYEPNPEVEAFLCIVCDTKLLIKDNSL